MEKKVDTFLANKVLAGQRPGSFLVNFFSVFVFRIFEIYFSLKKVRRSAATERSFACSLVTTKNKV